MINLIYCIVKEEILMRKHDASENEYFTIGRVGFDTITLTGIKRSGKPFNEKVEVNNGVEVHLPFYESFTDFDKLNNPRVTKSTHKVTIFGDYYTFRFGNQGKRGFARLKLFAHRDSSSSNLENMTVEKIWEKFYSAIDELNSVYHLKIPVDGIEEQLTIYEAEINNTFIIQDSFSSYKRCCDLLRYALPQLQRRCSKKATFTDVNSLENNIKNLETKYILNGATIKVKCYDKEKNEENDHNMHFDAHLMRLEINANMQNLLTMNANESSNSLRLKDITNDSVTTYFVDYFQKAFSYIDKYLKMNLEELANKNNSEIANKLLNLSIQQAIRHDAYTFVESMIRMLYQEELNSGYPFLLDIKDILPYISSLGLTEQNQTVIKEILLEIIKMPHRFEDCCLVMTRQQQLLEELKDMVLHPKEVKFFMATNILGKDKNGENIDKKIYCFHIYGCKSLEIKSSDNELIFHPFDNIYYKVLPVSIEDISPSGKKIIRQSLPSDGEPYEVRLITNPKEIINMNEALKKKEGDESIQDIFYHAPEEDVKRFKNDEEYFDYYKSKIIQEIN